MGTNFLGGTDRRDVSCREAVIVVFRPRSGGWQNDLGIRGKEKGGSFRPPPHI